MLGGLAAAEAGGAGLVPDTVLFTPSETEARGRGAGGFAVAFESGVAVEVRDGAGGLEAVEDDRGVRPVAAGAGALGTTDIRLVGAGGAPAVEFCLGGIALVAADVAGFAADAPVVVVFLRAALAEGVLAAGAAVAFAALGAAFTAPDPNVPELMIYARH